MRIETVNAIAFGSLKGESLLLPPGLAVVYGPNESGKSTWLHALYCALCGVTLGKRTDAERRFEDRYAPWFQDEWKVSAVVVLDDGRRLEVVQDLRKKTGYVTDLTTGKDLTADFTSSRRAGMPDLTTVCGVDRDFFRHVAIVPQGGVLDLSRRTSSGKKGSPSAFVRRFLQGATAVSGGPAGIADALRRVEAARDELGREGRGGSKPLNVAGKLLAEAEDVLDKARQAHEELISSEKTIKDLEARESELRSKIGFVGAVLRRAEAVNLSKALAEAVELAGKHPELEAGEWTEAVEVSRKIAESRTQLASACQERGGNGDPTEEEIQAKLAELEGPVASGDIGVDPREALRSLGDMNALYCRAKEALSALEAAATDTPTPPDLGRATPEELMRLAMAASTEPPPVDKTLEEALAAKEDQLRRAEFRKRSLLAGSIVGVALVLAGIAMLFWSPVGAAVTSLAGLTILALVLVALSRTAEGSREHHRLKKIYSTQVVAAERARRQVAEALRDAGELGLPDTREELQELAHAWRVYELARSGRDSFDEHLRSARSRLVEAAAYLATTLAGLREKTGLGWPETPAMQIDEATVTSDANDLVVLERAYEDASRLLHEAEAHREREGKKRELERALEARRRFGVAVEAACAALEDSGIEPPDDPYGNPDALLEALDAAERALKKNVDEVRWRFAALTGGRGLEELKAEVDRASQRADEAEEILSESDRVKAQSIARSASSSRDVITGYENDLEQSRGELVTVSEQLAAERRGFDLRFGQSAKGFVTVSEAEERVEEKLRAYEHFKKRAFVYEKTVELLRAAEQKMHTLLAPRLQRVAASLTAEVTLSRYDEVFVDDEQPVVRVRRLGAEGEKGPVTEADRLSYGTAEQIYLIFRMVVADTAATKDSIPLILDESTVYADSVRLGRLLEILEAAAEGKGPLGKISQVVLFTQEDEVAGWARAHLAPPNLVELARI